MRSFLMHPDRDFDPELKLPHWSTYRTRNEDPRDRLLPHERALISDLGIDLLIAAMADRDEFLSSVADKAILSACDNDIETVIYRQDILRDSLAYPAVIRKMYQIAVEAIETSRGRWWDISSRYVSSVLHSSVGLLEALSALLRQLRSIADENADKFTSTGFSSLFAMLQHELNDEYLDEVAAQLRELKFPKGVIVNADLGEWNESTDYVVHDSTKEPSWFERFFGNAPPRYTYRLHPRDIAGARILSEMRSRAIGRVTVAVAQSADHVLSFFKALRTELGFYVGCLNLSNTLSGKNAAMCIPSVSPQGSRIHSFLGLRDLPLALQMTAQVVGNDLEAAGRDLVVITGANQGGKSVFLRSVGVAQLMMQAGMFVAADKFRAEMCAGLFTHYKREEDVTMESGKLDEELLRISDIVDHVSQNSLLLCNESFAATNEREGSEIARQIVSALVQKGVKIFFVTHLYDFARQLFESNSTGVTFLRAERAADGSRTFKILPGDPLPLPTRF